MKMSCAPWKNAPQTASTSLGNQVNQTPFNFVPWDIGHTTRPSPSSS
jgi:hypothetical protein